MASYTLTQLQDAVLHAAAVASLPSTTSTTQIINRALDYLATCHGWAWRTVLVNKAAATAIDLPTDFGELISVVPQSGTKRMVRVELHELLTLRQLATPVAADANLSTCCFYALTGKAQASVTAAALWKLELTPTSPAVTIAYRRIPPALSSGSDVADIPAGFFDLFLQLCRCFATSMQKPASPETAPEWAVADRMIARLKEADARAGVSKDSTDQKLIENIIEDKWNVGRFRPDWA